MDESIPGKRSGPARLGGTPMFVGTRVPVRAMMEDFDHDRPLAEFLDDVPTVGRALAGGVLERMKSIVAHAPAAR